MPYFTFPMDSGAVQVAAEGPDLKVMWCSDWTRVDTLKSAGYLRLKHHPIYSHTDYHVTPGWKADAEPKAVRLFEPAPTQLAGQLSL